MSHEQSQATVTHPVVDEPRQCLGEGLAADLAVERSAAVVDERAGELGTRETQVEYPCLREAERERGVRD